MFHVNLISGAVGECHVNCELSALSHISHFPAESDAVAAYQESLTDKYGEVPGLDSDTALT